MRGAIVIDGFPSVGLVSSIVGNYMVNSLELEQVAVLESSFFPAVSLIRNSEPLSPVRVYCSERVGREEDTDQLVVFISEFQPPPNLIKNIASTVLDWVQEQRCKMLISPEGLVIEREGAIGPVEKSEKVYGVGSTKQMRNLIREYGIHPFKEGVITGIAGVLLTEGKRRDFDVISLLAEAYPEYPDARAAALVIEVINKILKHIKIDTTPLLSEAKTIESQLKQLQKQTKVIKQIPLPHMYR